ncbi:MAG: exosortase K [Smithellaceae bacterium]
MNRCDLFTTKRIACCLLVVLMATGMKYFYSRSTSEDLVWILGPTASLVEFITCTPFVREVNIGYVCAASQMAIVPACAGINFMIAAFSMTALTLIYHSRQNRHLSICVLAGLAAAYVFTLGANSLRIALSIHLYRADIYSILITPERVHRLTGIAVYFISLCLLYFSVRKITSCRTFFPIGWKNECNTFKSSLLSCLVPLCWYLLVALALPAINQASGINHALFREHAWSVFTVSFLLFVMMFLLVMCYRLNQTKQATYMGNDYENADSHRG